MYHHEHMVITQWPNGHGQYTGYIVVGEAENRDGLGMNFGGTGILGGTIFFYRPEDTVVAY